MALAVAGDGLAFAEKFIFVGGEILERRHGHARVQCPCGRSRLSPPTNITFRRRPNRRQLQQGPSHFQASLDTSSLRKKVLRFVILRESEETLLIPNKKPERDSLRKFGAQNDNIPLFQELARAKRLENKTP